MTILYNPRSYNSYPGVRINDLWQGSSVRIEPNEMKRFSDDGLASYLLKKYGFLRKVEVDQVLKVKAEIERPEAKDKEDLEDRKLKNLTEKQLEALEALPTGDVGEYVGTTVSFTQKALTPEESAGIPSGENVTDKDGVTWTGEGLQEDKPEGFMAPRRPGKSKGVFGAA